MKIKNINLIITLICVLLIFLLNINSVLSQNQEDVSNQNNQSTSQPLVPKENTIRMGVRLSSELFAKTRYRSPKNSRIEGYCINLGHKLAANFNKIVEYQAIANDDAGDKYKRYNGLRDGLIDLECGPNTIFPPLQPSEITEENKWKEDIVFSEGFYTTNFKLLLKKDKAEELETAKQESDKKFFNKIKDIGIEVVQNTTTYLAFKDYNNSSNSKTYTINKYKYKTKTSPPKTRYEALSHLDGIDLYNPNTVNNTAYVNDLPILQTILEKGFIDKGYVIFPEKKEDYLPGFEDSKYKQKYGIAFYSKANLNHIGININNLVAGVSTIIRDNDDLKKYLDTRSKQIEERISLVQDYYENKSWEDPSISTKNNSVNNNSNKPNYLTIIAFICLLGITLYSLYLIFSDSDLRQQFLSQFIVVIIGLFTGLVPLLLALLEGK